MVVHMRHTRAHTGNRRSHHALAAAAKSVCPKCTAPTQPHRACAQCGTYRGREVFDVLKKVRKDEKRRKKEEVKK